MASLSLEQFRDVKERGFPGWETAMRAGPNEEPYVCPADARYGEPWFPFGAAPRWRAKPSSAGAPIALRATTS